MGEEEKRGEKKEDADEGQRVGKRSYQEIKIIRLEKGESVLDTCYFSIFFFLQVLLSFQKPIINTWNCITLVWVYFSFIVSLCLFLEYFCVLEYLRCMVCDCIGIFCMEICF